MASNLSEKWDDSYQEPLGYLFYFLVLHIISFIVVQVVSIFVLLSSTLPLILYGDPFQKHIFKHTVVYKFGTAKRFF